MYVFSDQVVILYHLLIALFDEDRDKLFCCCPELSLAFLFNGLELFCHQQSYVREKDKVGIVLLAALGRLANEILTKLKGLGLPSLLLEDVFEAL